MEGGNPGVSGDPTCDLYDVTVFDWLAGHSLLNRGINPQVIRGQLANKCLTT